MPKVIKEKLIYIDGINTMLIKGVEYPKDSKVVEKYPECFDVKEVKKTKKPKEETKEELLVEEPVVALEVTEEVEEKPKRRTRRKK